MNKGKQIEEDWLFEIKPKRSFFSLDFKEIWRYRDLLILFVKRDVVTVYKQTILGPLWYLIQPLLTSVIFTIIFNNVAGIQTGAIPSFLYNLAGIVVWNYFTSCLNDTSDTFKKNAAVFGKVYFPRVIVPLSVVISNLLKLGIQFLIFIGFYLYYFFIGKISFELDFKLLLLPLLVMIMGVLGLGLGMVISSMVTKYRDLSFLVSFGVQLLMYISAVMYPIELVKEKLPRWSWIVEYNPLANVIVSTRWVLLNEKEFSAIGILRAVIISLIILFVGLLLFNKTEKDFIDTI